MNLRETFGSARHPERPPGHDRPEGLDDATVEALGKISEALEVIEYARGQLYQFHRMSGTADLTLQEAVRKMREAGHTDLADEIADVLVGRDVIPGMWTYQIVENYDRQYWQVFRAVDEHARQVLGATPETPKHVFEAEMKVAEQTDGLLSD